MKKHERCVPGKNLKYEGLTSKAIFFSAFIIGLSRDWNLNQLQRIVYCISLHIEVYSKKS